MTHLEVDPVRPTELDSRFRGNDIALKLFSVMPALRLRSGQAPAGIQDLRLLRVTANEIHSRGLLLLRGTAFNAVPWFRDRFTVAAGATARACESAAVAEDEAAILALGGFQDEAERAISRHGLDDVTEMVLDLSLRNPDNLSESPR
jgi:hypothetical protein